MEMYKATEVATKLGISESALLRALKKSGCGSKIGRQIFVSEQDLNQLYRLNRNSVRQRQKYGFKLSRGGV